MRFFTKCVFLTIVVPGTVCAQSASKRVLVANLKNNTVADGCGCYFKFRGTPRNAERYLFVSSAEEDDEHWESTEYDATIVVKKGTK
ncbi:hypothetical protein BH20ACI3_BH20ACI3_16490 [soil metagenome]